MTELSARRSAAWMQHGYPPAIIMERAELGSLDKLIKVAKKTIPSSAALICAII